MRATCTRVQVDTQVISMHTKVVELGTRGEVGCRIVSLRCWWARGAQPRGFGVVVGPPRLLPLREDLCEVTRVVLQHVHVAGSNTRKM